MLGMDNKNGMESSEFVEFFIDELKDIYWAEQHLVEALVKMKAAATSKELANAFEKHRNETEGHITILETIFDLMNESPKAKKCDAMNGIIKEAEKVIGDTEKDSFTRDAALVLAAQKAEHYEIATYGTLRIFAHYLDNEEIVSLLEKILQNEKDTDVALTILAESYINERAAVE